MLLFLDLQNQMQSEIQLGLYSPPANPPSSSGIDLPDAKFTLRQPLSRSIHKSPMGSMYAPGMMPYGPMMYPQMLGFQPQFVPGMGNVGMTSMAMPETSVSKKSINPAHYVAVSFCFCFRLSSDYKAVKCLRFRIVFHQGFYFCI